MTMEDETQPAAQHQPHILIVGGANTGRSAMAVPLLRRMLRDRDLEWGVDSAGVLGHDESPAELEACSAMHALDLDITSHTARSLTDEMTADATVIIAIDSGIVHVLRRRDPELVAKTTTPGDLAGRQRNIPDPYRMQIATWVSYAREIESLLKQGLDNLIEMVQAYWQEQQREDADAEMAAPATQPDEEDSLPPHQPAEGTGADAHAEKPEQGVDVETASADPLAHVSAELLQQRTDAVERCLRLLNVKRDMPELIVWGNAQQQLEGELQKIAELAFQPKDLIHSYANLVIALLGLLSSDPTTEQVDELLAIFERMKTPVDQQMMAHLSHKMVALT